ncbi:MAG: YbaN family protein [Gemmataceae bacterium]|nr:YbaN family protein [Gemmataceae bacterium]
MNIGLGLLFVGLAALGTVLPLLPTTPFLILASACFVRSAPRLNAWLLRTRLFGPLLRDWQHHRRVSRRVKHLAIVLIVLFVGLSAWLGDFSWPWLVALIVLALIGLAVVIRLPEKPEPRLEEIAAIQGEADGGA